MDVTASLLERLATLPDPRSPQGRRYPSPAVLGLAVLAMLAGMTSLEAIAQFGRLWGPRLAHLLGFKSAKTPSKATPSRTFRATAAAPVEALLAEWVRGRCPDDCWRHLALDGKVLRGSEDGEAPAVHLLTAYAPEVAAVVAQMRLDGTTDEHKAALQLLGVVPLQGEVVTADAMFTHRDLCAAVVGAGGDYILPVKDNRPALRADIEAAFAAPAALSPPAAAPAPAELRLRHRAQRGARPSRAAHADGDELVERIPGLARGGAGLPAETGADRRRRDGRGGGLRDHQPGPAGGVGGGIAAVGAAALVDREPAIRGAGRDAR
jgi:hypothetical protein